MGPLLAFVFLLAISLSGCAPGDGRRAAARGREVYQKHCLSCHATDHTFTEKGPGLGGLFGRRALVNGKDLNEPNVREIIRRGVGRMPGFGKLTPQEMDDLMAYLRTL